MPGAAFTAGDIVQIKNAFDLEGDVLASLYEGQVASRVGDFWQLNQFAVTNTHMVKAAMFASAGASPSLASRGDLQCVEVIHDRASTVTFLVLHETGIQV